MLVEKDYIEKKLKWGSETKVNEKQQPKQISDPDFCLFSPEKCWWFLFGEAGIPDAGSKLHELRPLFPSSENVLTRSAPS